MAIYNRDNKSNAYSFLGIRLCFTQKKHQKTTIGSPISVETIQRPACSWRDRATGWRCRDSFPRTRRWSVHPPVDQPSPPSHHPEGPRLPRNWPRGRYPLVMTKTVCELENGHWNNEFSHYKWWCSKAMWVYQRVAETADKIKRKHGHNTIVANLIGKYHQR